MTFGEEVSHQLMAYTCTVIEHCIGEWAAEGDRVKSEKFEKAKAGKVYTAHLEMIKKLELAQKGAFKNYRKRMMTKAR